MTKITKTEVTNSEIRATLSNGVTVDLSFFHDGRIHLHFSGLDDGPGVVVGAIIPGPDNMPTLQMSNGFDVAYKPRPA